MEDFLHHSAGFCLLRFRFLLLKTSVHVVERISADEWQVTLVRSSSQASSSTIANIKRCLWCQPSRVSDLWKRHPKVFFFLSPHQIELSRFMPKLQANYPGTLGSGRAKLFVADSSRHGDASGRGMPIGTGSFLLGASCIPRPGKNRTATAYTARFVRCYRNAFFLVFMGFLVDFNQVQAEY